MSSDEREAERNGKADGRQKHEGEGSQRENHANAREDFPGNPGVQRGPANPQERMRSGGAGGRRTYCLRPSQKISVAMNMSAPGTPKCDGRSEPFEEERHQ